ncbi:MAG TPA: UDP-N-acetylmuramate--L-alanine ligase [Candidatus Babeliales bacterium]|nr:UDP-N-acetylmuramate--L-alanine ligase [Candidatus Babeliales bacterium]
MYTKKKHFHFVGIGGIGMSGIATILQQEGYTISGCDPDITQDTVKKLQKLGCSIYHDNNSPQCDDQTIDILVYIPMYATTIPTIMAEIKQAKARNIPTISRANMLSELMQTKYSIAISGSHGKTTTSSLISHLLIEAQRDPTVIIGGQLKNISSNARKGNGNLLVAEADESDRSFLELHPTVAIITNIDLEHLETYTDLDDIKSSFQQFINNISYNGKAIICIDDKNIRSLLPIHNVQTLSYGIDHPADFSARTITLAPDHSSFSVYTQNNSLLIDNIILPIPGIHNVYNALAAIALAQELAIDSTIIKKGLASFSGVERRFSFLGTYKDAELFDDYGHHPTEIELTLIIARKRTKNKLIVVFQPHRYTRTQKLWSDFLAIFIASNIDTLIITDIYSAGEQPINNISSKLFAEELQSLSPSFSILYVPFEDNFNQIKAVIKDSVTQNDLVLFLGAGKVHIIGHELTVQ